MKIYNLQVREIEFKPATTSYFFTISQNRESSEWEQGLKGKTEDDIMTTIASVGECACGCVVYS